MPKHGLAKTRVIFSTTYHSSLKAITETYDILFIPIFQGTSLKKKKSPLGELSAEKEVIKARVTSCCRSVQHLTQQTPDLARGAGHEEAALCSSNSH